MLGGGGSWVGSTGGASASFTTIQTPSGTSPVATGPTDTLSLQSSDGSVGIAGSAGADSVDITVDIDDILPDQTGNSGKFLTTNGTTASWAASSSSNIDGGAPDSTYGGTTDIDGGTP